MAGGAMAATGKVGEGDGLVSPEQAKEPAQQCALNAIAAIKALIGDLDKVEAGREGRRLRGSGPGLHRSARRHQRCQQALRKRPSATGEFTRDRLSAWLLSRRCPVEVEVIVHVAD